MTTHVRASPGQVVVARRRRLVIIAGCDVERLHGAVGMRGFITIAAVRAANVIVTGATRRTHVGRDVLLMGLAIARRVRRQR